tara:strand:- start:89 stop:298 length:210 start_codon:yes stop_codon:yes gene_type:complete
MVFTSSEESVIHFFGKDIFKWIKGLIKKSENFFGIKKLFSHYRKRVSKNISLNKDLIEITEGFAVLNIQ